MAQLDAKALRAFGLGDTECARVLAASTLADRCNRGQGTAGAINQPHEAYAYVASYFFGAQREQFVVVVLDAHNRPQTVERVAMGSVDTCPVDPREVFLPAVRQRGSGVIVAHNHPSGETQPSPEDVALTDRLCSAGNALGIPLLDHLVIGLDGEFVSMAERGLVLG